jgi:hypothetical protein
LKHTREIEQATATNPWSRGGLLPLHGSDDGVDVREGGEAAFPPPIFAGTTSVFVIRVSPPPRFAIVEGVGLYIGVFRSSWASGDKGIDNRARYLSTP